MTTTATWVDPAPPRSIATGLVQVASVNATGSEGFADWLTGQEATLVVTTGDRVLTVSAEAGELLVGEHRADVVTGLAVESSRTVHLATKWQLHRLEDALEGHPGPSGEDRFLVNQVSHTTGFVGAYDLAVDRTGRVLFSNTLCNCVATPAQRVNFSIVFAPRFITGRVAEERCHLTGLAVDEHGDLGYVTCAAETDDPAGWRDRLVGGGVVVDVATGETLARGLVLPGSPRVHDGQLYVTEGGTGRLLRADRATGAIEPVVALPGLTRGLAFLGGRALVGCSLPPKEGPYAGLPIAVERPGRPRNGIAVVDLERSTLEHSLTIEAGSNEIYAIGALLRTKRLGLRLNATDLDGWFVVDVTKPDLG